MLLKVVVCEWNHCDCFPCPNHQQMNDRPNKIKAWVNDRRAKHRSYFKSSIYHVFFEVKAKTRSLHNNSINSNTLANPCENSPDFECGVRVRNRCILRTITGLKNWDLFYSSVHLQCKGIHIYKLPPHISNKWQLIIHLKFMLCLINPLFCLMQNLNWR